jgi:hypothetical protein
VTGGGAMVVVRRAALARLSASALRDASAARRDCSALGLHLLTDRHRFVERLLPLHLVRDRPCLGPRREEVDRGIIGRDQ